MNKNFVRRGCLVIAGILFLIFLIPLNRIEKEELYSTEGRTFEKARVVEILEDNLTENGNRVGRQRVMLEILSGEQKGKQVEALSSASYLFGAECRKGMKVIAMISESGGELAASVYSADRELPIYLMIGVFLLVIILIGGKKGVASVLGLGFTLVCIGCLFLPMIYRGISPILAAVFVVAVTTTVTVYLIGGLSKKSVTALLGTVTGVLVAAVFAWIFGKVTQISGYNVSDIENLIYVEEKTNIRIGELLFAGILIAALGAVMDVGMSIASTLQEIYSKRPELSFRELFKSGMNVGRDMMGTMSNTLILAFTGGSVNTLVFLYAYDYSYHQIMNMYSVGIELMQGISASMGVILTVPFTSFIGAWMLTAKKKNQHIQG